MFSSDTEHTVIWVYLQNWTNILLLAISNWNDVGYGFIYPKWSFTRSIAGQEPMSCQFVRQVFVAAMNGV